MFDKKSAIVISAIICLIFQFSFFGNAAKLPLTISGKGSIAPDGRSVSIDCELSCPEILNNIIVDVNINTGDSLLSYSPSGLIPTGGPLNDSIEKLTRYSFILDMAKLKNFTFKVSPGAAGDHKIYIRVISQISEDVAWSDEYSYYYHDDGSKITEGYQVLNKEFRTEGVQVTPGTIPEFPQPPRQPASPTTPPEKNVTPPDPAGTVTVTGRWMYYDEADNYSPQFERLCELFDSGNNHLAWAYTDWNGYFTFPAVTNPGCLYVTIRTETYYNRAGGTDHLWVRNSGGSIYYTYTSTQCGVPDGTYNIGEWNTPNGSTYEKGYWAIKKIQDVWRYIYFIDTVNMYPGSIQCQWYVGSTDGTYYNYNEMIHLAENDPTGTYTVVHESGHNIMNTAYGGVWPSNDCPSPHYVELYGGPHCGWTEGWGDFLPMPVYGSPTLSWPSGGTENFENPTWGTVGWDSGSAVEGRVCGALWDIIDSNNEGKDFYTDSVLNIWQTVWNANSDTFCQFWDSSRSYGIKRSRDNCLYQCTIDSCNTCVEDPWENDDNCAQALGEGSPSTYTYEHCTDEDWQYVDVEIDWTYTWETNDLGYSGDTTLTLYAVDCTTQLSFNDDKSTGNWPLSSKIVWTSDRTARVYIVARQYGGSYGSHKSYDIILSRACSTTPAAASGLDPAYDSTVCTSSPTLLWTGYGRNYDVILDGSTLCASTTSTFCSTSGLSSGWHWWYVVSRNGCGNTSSTSTYWFYVGTSPSSSTTTAVDADACADTGVNITWSAPASWGDSGTGTRSFSIWRNDIGYIVTGLSAGTTSYNDNTGTNGTSYQYWVRPINTCGYGTWYSVSASVADNIAASPSSSTTTAVDANTCTDTGVNITWSAPASWGDNGSGTRTYSVYRSDSIYVATGLSEGTISYNDNTGTNGTNYNYWVRAINGCSYGTWYSASASVADLVADFPSSSGTTVVDANACADTGVNITWSAPASWGDNGIGTRTFSVYRSDSVYVATGLSAGTTSYNDNTGVNGAAYNYWVRAINGCSYGTWYSASASVADNIGSTPTTMATTAVDNNATTDTGVDISWSTPTVWGDNGYNSAGRQYNVYRDVTLIGTFGAGTLSMNDNGGTNNVNYTYHVDAVNGCGILASYSSQVAMDAVAASPGETSPSASPQTSVKASGTSVTVNYTGTSCDADHSIYWGTGTGSLTGCNWINSACLLGDTGAATFDPGTPAAGSFFYFVIVGNTGSAEGSYGKNSSDTERPVAVAPCFGTQDLTACP